MSSGRCECGCGRELTGKQEKYASSQCRHRVIYHRHKERHKAARLARRRQRRAARILASTAQPCENLRKGGRCWIYAEGCAAAKASGRCTYRPKLTSVEQVLALPPGRVRTSPIKRPCTCKTCGAEFMGAKRAQFCSNACRCKDYWIGRRERDGRKARIHAMPAERIKDGQRRCRWCQAVIDGNPKRQTCSRRCIERVNNHNAGRSYSSTVMSERL